MTNKKEMCDHCEWVCVCAWTTERMNKPADVRCEWAETKAEKDATDLRNSQAKKQERREISNG